MIQITFTCPTRIIALNFLSKRHNSPLVAIYCVSSVVFVKKLTKQKGNDNKKLNKQANKDSDSVTLNNRVRLVWSSLDHDGKKTYILFSIAALSRIENISHVNTRDNGREPTSQFDLPVYSLLVVPYTSYTQSALACRETQPT